MTIGIGATIGNYLVKSKLGEGAMGTVFLAEHPLIGSRVALKVIKKDVAADTDAVSRFFTEARAVNRIGHENIVNISDFGQTPDGDVYYIMELLVGESLAERLARGQLPPAWRRP